MISYEIDRNGNLVLIADEMSQFTILDMLDDGNYGYATALQYVIEEVQDNRLEALRPEDIGVSTESPIFGFEVKRNEEGFVTSAESLFWFPNYEIEREIGVENELKILGEHGFVVIERNDKENLLSTNRYKYVS